MKIQAKEKLNKAQKENKKEIQVFKKKENASYRLHLKNRKTEKKLDKKHSKEDLSKAHEHMKKHGG